MAKLLLLNGPNLNLLGVREPEKYGTTTLGDIVGTLQAQAAHAGHTLDHLQSNAEHVLLERVHAARTDGTAFILINPAASPTPASPCAMPCSAWRCRLSKFTFPTFMRAKPFANTPIFPTLPSVSLQAGRARL